MSLRRKSCETCFRSKRKCDLTLPACRRCQRIGKVCQYAYSPSQTASCRNDGRSSSSSQNSGQSICKPHLPNMLGPLGEIRPIIGQSQSWEWSLQQFRSYPVQFAQNLEVIFIRKDAETISHAALRTAFGICGAHAVDPDSKRRTPLWKIIDAEVAHLLNVPSNGTVLQDLSRLQALVLYQILRLLHGDMDERITAERQEPAMQNLCTRLLNRVNTELGSLQATWDTWVIAENIRRTVMIAHCLYCMYWLHHIGHCPFFSTLKTLPVSTRPELWQSDSSSFLPLQDIPISYEDYSMAWAAAPRRRLSPFEKLLLVPCKGLDQVEMYSTAAD